MKRQHCGLALIMVVWLLAMTSLMLGGLVTVVRQESQLSLWQREHTRAIWAAEGGLALAVRGLTDPLPTRRWVADGRAYWVDFDGTRLSIRVRSERGKLDLNAVSAKDLMRVVVSLGGTAEQARAFAAQMSQRRLEQAPIRALEETGNWPGMNRALYDRVAPELTLWSGLPRPDSVFASPTVRQVLNLVASSAEGVDPGPVLAIESRALTSSGFSAVISSTVLLSIEQNSQPFRVLSYSE
jgi:general secretion pathway protein K